MKLRADIEVPEGASWQDIEDAKLKAQWRTIVTTDDRMRRTNLDGKCGSCKFFHQIERLCGSTCYGKCEKGLAIRQRSVKACKRYTPND